MNKIAFSFLISLLVLQSVNAQHKIIPIPFDSAVWISLDEDWHEGEPHQPHSFRYDLGRTEGINIIINGKS